MTADSLEIPRSRLGAFAHAPFAVIWLATTCSLTGIAISDTASAWLMTSLNADPRAVSLTQVASNLPMFLFTLPAGALADRLEPRRFLIALETFVTVLMAVFGAVIFFHLLTTAYLLGTIFVLGAAWSLAAPAWLSITPLLVPPGDLCGANAANSVGYNFSRAIGPAFAGFAIASLGPAAPYWIFAAADFGSIVALIWWRPARRAHSGAPLESLSSAVRTGLRHAMENHGLRATIIRTVAVYPFASAYLALLPLVARAQGGHGAELYGVLLAVVSAGAVIGSFAIEPLNRKFGPDLAVAICTAGLAAALILFGLARDPAVAGVAAFLAGASWTIVLAILYVSAQVSLPDWVRGRGLAVFLTVIFGSVTLGSLIWGQVAAFAGLSSAQFIAAGGALVVAPLTLRWKLRSADDDASGRAGRGPFRDERREFEGGRS